MQCSHQHASDLCCRVQAGAVDCLRVAPYLPCLANACRVDLDRDRRGRIVLGLFCPLGSPSLSPAGLDPERTCGVGLKMIPPLRLSPLPLLSKASCLSVCFSQSLFHSPSLLESHNLTDLLQVPPVHKVLYFPHCRVLSHFLPQFTPPSLLFSSPPPSTIPPKRGPPDTRTSEYYSMHTLLAQQFPSPACAQAPPSDPSPQGSHPKMPS